MPDKKKEKYSVPKENLQIHESTKRQKEALKSILKTKIERAKKQTYIDQFNAVEHVDQVHRDKRKTEMEKAAEIGAMNEISLVQYYDDFRKKIELLQTHLKKKAYLSQQEVISIKDNLKKEIQTTLQNLKKTKDLSTENIKEYQSEATKKIGSIKVTPNHKEYQSEPIINKIDDVKEVIQDATVHTEMNRENRINFELFCQKQIIPLTLSNKDILVTVGDFFSFPLGMKSDPNPFQQHIQYLKRLVEKRRLSITHYEKIEGYMDYFPIIFSRKHFNIFKGDHLKLITLDALYESWLTGKLQLMRYT